MTPPDQAPRCDCCGRPPPVPFEYRLGGAVVATACFRCDYAADRAEGAEPRPAGRGVTLGGVRVGCGPATAALLRAVRAGGGRCGAGEVCRAVWGGPAPMNRVYVLVHRASRRLAACGCARRLAVDGGDVVLC